MVLKRIVIVGIVLFLLNDLALAYNALNSQSPIVGLRLAGKPMIGQSPVQITAFIAQRFRQISSVRFTYSNTSITVRPVELGLYVSPADVMTNLLAEGRRGTWLQRFITQEKALLGLVNIPIGGMIKPTLLTLKILDIQNTVDTDPQPPRPDFTGDVNRTLPATNGTKVDVSKLATLLYQSMNTPGEKTFPLPVQSVSLHRQYAEEDVAPMREQAKKILAQPSAGLVALGLTFFLTPSDLRPILTVVERPDSKNPQRFILALRLNEKMLNRKLGDFAEQVEAKNHAEFSYQYARVALYGQIFSGKRGPATLGANLAPVPNVLGTTASPSGQPMVYLTFDDGPDPTYHPLVVDILKTFGVKATFFLIGRNAQKYPELVAKTLEGGNSINNHSLSHPFLPNLSASSILSELAEANTILQPMNQQQPIRLFRPPFGGTNRLVQKDASDMGMTTELWSIDPRDWSEPETNELARRVISRTVNGSIILLHSNHLATVRALPQIIQSLRTKGFDFGLL